ncbi:MAG: YybH family protein [Phenylobacterium sp.]|jgi:uncharacterized protein (TIGR02246 family)|uniref:YybH family protein n=1 Tax=Phenylobacterium sp. TaxID=1871053 RepID=UPI00391A447E
MTVHDILGGADEAQIRAVLDALAQAICEKDAAAAAAAYATDAVICDLAPPLSRSVSPDANREILEGWFATWRGPIGYETREVGVTKSGHLAVTRGFLRIHGTKADGERPDVWARQTLVLRKLGGAWRIVHEHTSVPFYMDGSLKAAVDLQP